MPWDDNKSTAADPDNPTADEQLTADEWDAHVADQKGHASRHEKGGSDELTTFGDTTHDTIDSDGSSIGETHTPEPSDDIAAFVTANSGDTIDLSGRTYEVSSAFSPPDDTTIKNGTIKLADGSDTDLFYRDNPSNLIIENVTFDFNGSNQTTDSAPGDNAYFTVDQSTDNVGGEGTEFRNCRWINASGRVTSATQMVFARGTYVKFIEPEMRLGQFGRVTFYSRQQMIIEEPEIVGCEIVEFRGQDGQVSGGNIVDCDTGVKLTATDVGDWVFSGGLIIEDNRIGVSVNTAIVEYNIVSFGDVQIQGSTEQGVNIESGGATTGRLVFDGTIFKRNGFNSSGGFAQVRLEDGQRVVFRNLTATNDSANDADHFILIGAGASKTIVDGVDALDSDYTSGTAIQDNAADTILGTNFTT